MHEFGIGIRMPKLSIAQITSDDTRQRAGGGVITR